jgi:GAF domain-containing protein
MPSDPRIRAAMDALAKTLASPADVDTALAVLTSGAVEAVPGADCASISVRHPDGKLETVAPTDPVICDLDARQYELQEGPCYDTVTSDSFTVTFDLDSDPRWPSYGPAAAGAGFHAQLAVLLTDNGKGRTALNLYAAQPHKFTTDSIEFAEMFASHAAVAMGYVRTMGQVGQALASRKVIGQALGIISERYQIDEDRAFDFLLRTSQDSNIKIREVAEQIVTGLNGRTHLEHDRPLGAAASGYKAVNVDRGVVSGADT